MRKNRQGFTLVEIMIVVAIIALLAAIAIPNLLRAKISANEALAKGTIRSMSTASETFATANNGDYPEDEDSLTTADPAYMNEDYCDETISGYDYECDWGTSGYAFTASPTTPGRSGTRSFVISTGGVLEEYADAGS